MAVVASLLLAAGAPNPGEEDATPVPGWSFATEGSGIPRDQDAGGFAAGVDREVAHGGQWRAKCLARKKDFAGGSSLPLSMWSRVESKSLLSFTFGT
jgi:hypothetical protein